jgi:hypothetical protein
MKVVEIQNRTKQLDTSALKAIDKALGTIKEHFKEIYDDCAFSVWQIINTKELSYRNH